MRAGGDVLIDVGPGATVAEITRRAGLSQGSFFTYFASKHELMIELVLERIEALHALALRYARESGPAMARLEAYIWDAAADLAPHRAYLEVANHEGAYGESSHAAATALDLVVTRLVSDAQRDGALRADVTAADIHALIMVSTLAALPYLIDRPTLWRRFIALSIAALRA